MTANRRQFLKRSLTLAASAAVLSLNAQRARSQAIAANEATGAVVINPKPMFDISPQLYMQFMEPLGVTDSSVEACWSYDAENWRKDFVDRSIDLAPDV